MGEFILLKNNEKFIVWDLPFEIVETIIQFLMLISPIRREKIK